jgi:hypothetical protein
MENVNIAPKQGDIDAIERSMRDMMRVEGVDAMVKEYAKALAYQNALNRVTIEIYKDIITEFKKASEKKV